MELSPRAASAASASHRPIGAVLALGIVLAAAGGYLLWKGNGQGSLFGGSHQLLLAPQARPLFPAAVLDTGAKKVMLLSVPGQGTASIIGYAHAADKNYYLLTADGKTSDIYAASPHTPGLVQLTHSPTLKLNLSYDAASGSFAYASVIGSSSRIGYLEAGTTTEVTLTEGTNPVLLKGGFFIVYEKDGKLMSVGTGAPKKHELLIIPVGGSYAVDPENLRIALYEPTTSTVQYYSIKSFENASAEKIEPAGKGFPMRILAFSNNQFVQLYASKDGLFVPNLKKKVSGSFIKDSGPYSKATVTAYEK